MILSVSRRTDIPNYYSDWFLNRLKEGCLYVRNPMNAHQISEISLWPDVVDCIVFWTKNPAPMIGRLDELGEYPFYFQFTLTGYGADIESGVPHKKNVMIPVFQKLAEKIGRERVIWRYDPIFFNHRYTPEYHRRAFSQIAHALNGYTDRCVISFVDIYAKNKTKLEALQMSDIEDGEKLAFAAGIRRIAEENGMEMVCCAEQMELAQCGIRRGSCIDRELIEKLTGCRIRAGKDRNQREQCGCIESVEVGTYDTCRNGCQYCYAVDGRRGGARQAVLYDPDSPLLCGKVMKGDRISKRKVASLKEKET